MRLRFTHHGVRRTWTVELRPQPGGPVLVCQQCAHSSQPLNGPSARAELLAHLALHARRTPLPTHLRTCQCHERGCHWHPRHRGCEGPIRLLLARAQGGRLWRLTDACTACAAATAQACVVPDTTLTDPSSPAGCPSTRRRQRHSRGPDSHTRVREMLNYLATALPTATPAAARLIALQCALRMDGSAHVRLPLGVLRSLRMTPSPELWRGLEQAGWLRRAPLPPQAGKPVIVAQLLDAGLLAQCPARPDRLSAADWALRAACRPRTGPAPLHQLVATCLMAHTAPKSREALTEADRLAYECGLPASAFTDVLRQLTAAGFLSSWTPVSASGDLEWMLTESASPASPVDTRWPAAAKDVHTAEVQWLTEAGQQSEARLRPGFRGIRVSSQDRG